MIKIITPPASEPISLIEAKIHCKVDGNHDDALLAIYIAAAREAVEHITGRKLVTQTLEMALDAFPSAEISLPVAPVQSVASVKYINAEGVLTTVSSANYTLDNYGLSPAIVPASGLAWPAAQSVNNAVLIQFVAGYGAAADVPHGIKSWILLTVGTLYKNRESVTETQNYAFGGRFYDSLLDPYRLWNL